MAHRCHRATCSQCTVLTSPDLLERILELLPVPKLCLGSNSGLTQQGRRGRCARVIAGDRWAAGQVNRAFRQAALSLPWEAYLEAYTSRPNISEDTLALVCGPRKLASLRVWLLPGAIASCAGLLGHASSVQVLQVSFDKEDTLLDWLQHTQGAGPCEGKSVLACLSSLSRLTSLTVGRFCQDVWRSASWLTAISQLRDLKLYSYAGPPVGVLPRLQSLDTSSGWHRSTEQQHEHALDEWAQPRLTALTLCKYRLRVGVPDKGTFEQGCGAWLSQVQRLSLFGCLLSVHRAGLQTLVPGLTYLELHYGWNKMSDLCTLVRRELPLSLKELHIHSKSVSLEVLQSAVSVLSNLVTVELVNWNEGAENDDDDVAAALRSLTALPSLDQATWTIYVKGSSVKHSWDRALGALKFHRVSMYV